MNNKTQTVPAKPLKSGFCGFCYFVRGHEGDTSPHTRVGAGQHLAVHNNKNNNNIYINMIAGSSVTSGEIV
ncbi:hypothetical protein C8P66_1347 [Humitalea rosea]|uniref:Uncharacterized protein n=1 Tax=Humitalea rosea TaxID=990373 RepID=A0A2W7IJK9_9PROT|nr:hypothetical protein C8P66_1347 [Humitalea rosea]